MFSFSTFTLFALLASASIARADVVPSEPSPGRVYNEGTTCPIVWQGDSDSPTAWKNMTIELMTGDNFNMIHLATVATAQDGTTNGRFDFPCPNVSPNSAIYFYQFTSPGSPDKTWTTRFTIASTTGATTPPANATQPDGSSIPWGVGTLNGSSQAGTVSSSPASSGVVPTTSSSVTPYSVPVTSDGPTIATFGSSSRMVVSAIASVPSPSPSATTTGTGFSGANALSAFSITTSLIIPALAFIIL